MSNLVRIHHAKGRADRSNPRVGFLASTLSAAVARNGYYIASAWILVERGYGTAGVATFLAIASIVEFIASPLAGLAADRFDRRCLNVSADLGRFVVMMATACALLYMDVFLIICLSAVLFSFCDRVALTSSQSMIPVIAGGRDLVASNSAVFFVMQFGNLGAALLAGPLLHERSPALPFTVLAAFFLFSAGCLALMRLEPVSRDVRIAKISAAQIDPSLRRLIVVYALLYTGAVLVSVLGSSFVFQEQKGTAVDFGYLEAAWSAGSLIGAVILIRIERAMSTHALHLMLLGLTALVLMALAYLSSPWTVVLFAALGFLYNLGRVSVEVTLQSHVSVYLLGRAKGIMHSVAVALGLLVFGIGAAVGDRAFPSTIFFSFGVVLLISISCLSVGAVQPQEKGES
ncbi:MULTISPECIES: MFS transporter [unclassified Mesorhizobium]|uniref:MFS transporter n=1 Tax=unclassified Mesorhizobium TaxID=325217 RepID=UPI00112A9FE4|nr:MULTISPECIES: MFS transporter [unclassified Mesorhizobium]MBZ9700965.1 MFS transporter [Mesorhizobium sp. CO1-1-3]MBZ9946901.1 MFS transporter [Mesorhizobium sp. BR1-1-11]TPJ04843.1 MFS transporter [Mesorhizobium sp. B2-8-1]